VSGIVLIIGPVNSQPFKSWHHPTIKCNKFEIDLENKEYWVKLQVCNAALNMIVAVLSGVASAHH
jgi:hypothetical protein